MEKLPFLSVVIPCRNEERYIEKCILSLKLQEYPKDRYEVLLIDGMSDDNTIKILEEIKKDFDNLKIITNPNKTTPFALNIGVKNSKGDIIVILGAHSIIPNNFLLNGVKLFEKYPQASSVGGPITSEGENLFGLATSYAMSSKIGIGNANHRFPDYEGEAEMACFPFYKKEVFEKVGLFDERFIKNQDDEFAFRVTKAGMKIYISPSVKSSYFVRNSPKKLFMQYFNYGYYKWLGFLKHKSFISLRHLVPTIFVVGIISLLIISLMLKNFLIIFLPIFSYFFVILIFSIKFYKINKKIPLRFLLAVVILHVSYGMGFLYSFVTQRKLK